MNYSLYILKRKLENIFIFPFIVLGKIAHLVKGQKNQYDFYFFFPFFHLGGAEKIHLQIAQLAKGKKVVIVFTRISNNEGFFNAFKAIGIDIEIASTFTNNNIIRLPLNLIARGYYAARINKDQATLLNGQSNFGYKISPWISKSLIQFELIHSFNSFSWIRIPFANYYTKTIMISENKIQEHIAQYKSIQAPSSLQERIVYIPNAVELIGGKKENSITKSWAKPFKVIYVGRGSEEKRISEIISVAKKAKENKLPFEFEIIGDVAEYIPADASNYVTLAGMINDKEILNAKYLAAHFIILLSSTEGMPLVILEAMQNGCIPIVTEVGDLPLVINNENGFLVQNNNLSVIQETFDNLVRISQLPTMQLELISNNARTLVSEKYSLAHFNVNYQQLLGI